MNTQSDFHCPYCGRSYSDADNRYWDRMTIHNQFIATIYCDCGNVFKITYNSDDQIILT